MAVNATAIWSCRPGGSDTNGAAYDLGISGAGTNYSKQNAAQLSLTDLASAGSGSNDVTSATGGFTAAMIGNAMYITGTGFTTGRYFITARAATGTVTLDRTPASSASAASGGTGNVGGAALTPMAVAASTGNMVGGNFLDAYSPNPTNSKIRTTTTSALSGTGTGLTTTIASTTNFPTGGLALIDAELVTYTRTGSTLTLTGRGQSGTTAAATHNSGAPVTVIDYATNRTATTLAQGSSSAGKIIIRSDPAGGSPTLFNPGSAAFFIGTNAYVHFENMTFMWGNPGTAITMMNASGTFSFKECNFFYADPGGTQQSGNVAVNGNAAFLGCLFEAETINVTPTVKTNNAFLNGAGLVYGCVFRNLNSNALGGPTGLAYSIIRSQFYNNLATSVLLAVGGGVQPAIITNNTFDNNQGNSLTIQSTVCLAVSIIENNIFSNNTGASTAAINMNTGSAPINDTFANMMGNNAFYNNTSNYIGLTAKASDTIGVNPAYINAAGGNHTPGPAMQGIGYPTTPAADATSFVDLGAIQHADSGGSGSGGGPSITVIG